MKWLKRGIIGILILFLLAVVTITLLINPFGPSPVNDYPRDGELVLQGLRHPVRVVRDEKGMPYIHAADTADLLFAQGFVMAQDRLFQMELIKLMAAGRIGELAGEKARELDIRMRSLGFHRNARRHYRRLNDESKAYLRHFAEGVNAMIARNGDVHLEFRLAGIRPTPWTPVDSLAIFYYMGWNSAANLQNEIVSQMLVEILGWQRAAELFPLNVNPAEAVAEQVHPAADAPPAVSLGIGRLTGLLALTRAQPLRVGSNNWAVSPGRTVNGKPILANDPHLDAAMLPGPWYPCGLVTPEFRAVGVAIAGTPGISAGRTDHLAFGMTNAYGDAQDLYIETVDPRDPGRYMEGDRSIPFTVFEETLRFKDDAAPAGYTSETIHIRATRRGPVVSDLLPVAVGAGKLVTVRWSAFEAMGPSLGFERFLTCRDAAQFREALRDVRQICLNFVFADRQGDIGWHVTGRIPIRQGQDGRLPHAVRDGRDTWTGWIPFEEMPHAANPPAGWLGTTNHKIVPRDYPYYFSDYFAAAGRQRRLMQLMGDAGPTSAQDHWRYQRDAVNLKADRVAPIMAAALQEHPGTADIGRVLGAWAHEDHADQTAPTLFHAVFNEFARQVFVDELGEAPAHVMLSNTYYWEERLVAMIEGGTSAWFDDTRTSDVVETQADIWHRAALNAKARLARLLGDDMSRWQWGRLHRYTFVSPIAREGRLRDWLGGGSYPAAGSGDTLRRTRSPYDDLSKIPVMASLRMVADLGDPEKIWAVLPGGVTGRQFHPHFTDQIEAFVNGQQVYWWFSDEAIAAHAKHELMLRP